MLDFGSGLGGPARYMANKTHCHVTAVEIQEELNEIALDLTKRCELSDRVHHIRQNIRDFDIGIYATSRSCIILIL